ncbi:unnamed protein product [Nezara viridula]|uniref:Uncharacterized protein n=1 Tax=Nezara viridula TaxID=85310 RepID=A0A9P0HSK7_NEZVI|nr:unnamed protein product [Nezara viridula]
MTKMGGVNRLIADEESAQVPRRDIEYMNNSTRRLFHNFTGHIEGGTAVKNILKDIDGTVRRVVPVAEEADVQGTVRAVDIISIVRANELTFLYLDSYFERERSYIFQGGIESGSHCYSKQAQIGLEGEGERYLDLTGTVPYPPAPRRSGFLESFQSGVFNTHFYASSLSAVSASVR